MIGSLIQGRQNRRQRYELGVIRNVAGVINSECMEELGRFLKGSRHSVGPPAVVGDRQAEYVLALAADARGAFCWDTVGQCRQPAVSRRQEGDGLKEVGVLNHR